MDFVEVGVEAPLLHPLTYRVPEKLKNTLKPGTRVEVPLGKRNVKGVVLKACKEPTTIKNIKDITSLTESPLLCEHEAKWLNWLSQYYLHPPGLVYSMAFAPHENTRKRKSKNADPLESYKPQVGAPAFIPTPNAEQTVAIKAITAASSTQTFQPFLLYGVTGSGKTEVYLRAIEEVLKQDKQVLVLVPEISLTPQLIQRFVGRFGEQVAVIHSHLTDREKSDQWQSILTKKKQILVGARSALFCPMENLGLIIIDEEHESSYKQEEQLKYHARDAAIMKGFIFGCPVVLGSATPSLETWHNVEIGKYKKLTLLKRVEDRPLPEVKIIDLKIKKERLSPFLKREQGENFLPSWLSEELFNELEERLKKNEQSALFINRRGFAQFLLCGDCGHTEECPHCSVTLTAHKRGSVLLCHYCGFQKPTPQNCTSCQSSNLEQVGLGTEKIAKELQELFPQARIVRADRDEINSRKSLEDLIQKISQKDVDVIVGTQMIAKGHDFPNLTLVGSLMADLGLHFPDFRSSERTFQLLTQVAGRAGRHNKPGKVFVQTYLPEHPAIHFSVAHDFEAFAQEELRSRKELGYPPFGRIAIVRIQGSNLAKTEKAAQKARSELERVKKLNPGYSKMEVLGPTEAALMKLKNKFRFQILVKSLQANELNIYLQHFLKNSANWTPAGITLSADVDPQQLL